MTKSKRTNTRNKNKTVTMNSTNKESIVTAPTTMFRSYPKSSFSIKEGSLPGSIIIKGSEYVGSVSTGASAPIGTVLRNDFISPGSSTFQGGRLPLFSRMYDKYRFKKMNFRYNPVVPTSSQGAILIAMDKDYADVTPNISTGDDAVLRTYLSWEFCTTGPSWALSNLNVTFSSDKDKLYYSNDTGYDGRLVYQGQFYTVAAATLSANTRYGFISIDYEIEFFDPQLDEAFEYSVGRNGVTADYSPVNTLGDHVSAGWDPLLTAGANSQQQIGFGSIISELINGNLRKGFYVPEGSYIIEQLVKNVASANGTTQKWDPPLVMNAYSGQSNSTTQNVVDTGLFTTGKPAIRIDKFTAPPGGSKIFGSLADASDQAIALTDVIVRIIPTLRALSAV